MAGEISFEDVAPVIPVVDLDAALERYRRLGFTATVYEGDARYGFVERGSVSLHVSESAEHDPKRGGAVVYLYVSDADALHAEWAESGVEGRLGTPSDTEYGLREFGFVDPDGTLHRVGSRLAASTVVSR
jgi:Glyoxalase/Bleomycin resistance protein/Dioxygenase superfamily